VVFGKGGNMNKEALKEEAVKWQRWFMKGQRNWSAVHYATVFGSIGCSVVAGAVNSNLLI
jgi:hypothetical protein